LIALQVGEITERICNAFVQVIKLSNELVELTGGGMPRIGG
jgi:hypothetical protein